MTTVVDAYADASDGEPVVICDFSPPRSGDPAFVERIAEVPADFICRRLQPGAHTQGRFHRSRARHPAAPGEARRIQHRSSGYEYDCAAIAAARRGNARPGERRHPRRRRPQRERAGPRRSASAGHRSHHAHRGNSSDERGQGLPREQPAIAHVVLHRRNNRPRKTPGERSEARRSQGRIRSAVPADTARLLAGRSGSASSQRTRPYQMRPLAVPVFWGLQILAEDGLVFGNVPASIREDLEKGRDGADIAAEMLASYVSAGIRGVYLVPPIRKGGVRDYAAAQSVLRAAGR